MKKELMFFNEQGSHEYDIIVTDDENGKEYELRRSMSHAWCEQSRGEHLITLFDNGDGIKFKGDSLPKPLKILDYSQVSELAIILQVMLHTDKFINMQGCKIIAAETIINF